MENGNPKPENSGVEAVAPVATEGVSAPAVSDVSVGDAAAAPVAPVEEVKAASMLVVLAKNASSVRATVNFLERRGFAAKHVPTLNDAVELFTKKEANMLLLSMNFPHPKVEMLPKLMQQSFNIETIVFAEETDRKSSNKLTNSKLKHVLFGPVSGPVVMMKLRQIEREMNGEAEADNASGEKRSMGSKEEQGDIKIGGKRASNDDTVVLNGKTGAGSGTGAKAFDNLMKSLDEEDAVESSSDGLSRSGDTYVAKGERSKMKSAGGDGSDDSDDGGSISQDAQDLRAALDRGLSEAPKGQRAKLILPKPRARDRAAMDAGREDGERSGASGGRGAGAGGAGFDARAGDASDAGEDAPTYEQAAAAMRAAEHEKAVEAARERKEKEDAAAAAKAEKDAALAASKAEREALAAKQKAEREETAAKMKAEREASAAKAKADNESAAAEKQAAVAERARAEREAEEKSAQAQEAASGTTALEKKKDELGVSIDEALEAALFGGPELEKVNQAKAASVMAAAAVAAPDAVEASRKAAEKAQAEAEAREAKAKAQKNAAAAAKAKAEKEKAAESARAAAEAQAVAKAAAEAQAVARADEEARKEQEAKQPAAGASAERELTDAEKLALSPEDKVQRCLREALAIVAGAPKESVFKITDEAKAALITLRSPQMHCAFVVSLNFAKQTANELFHRMEIAFFSLLRDHGVEFENQDTFSIFLDNLGVVKNAFDESEFAVVTQTADIEIGAARVFVNDPMAKVEPYANDMHTINLRDVPLNIPVTFSLFLHFKRNEKFIRYLKKGSSIGEKQISRLEEHKAQGLIERQEIDAYKRHYAAHAIQAAKKRAS